MPINIPNLLTAARVISIPLVLVLHFNGHLGMSIVVLVLGLITDFLDGFLARRLNQETHFGAIFDPIADKFVALGFYGYIAWQGMAPNWFVGIVLLRNFSQLMSVPILIFWLKKTFYVKPSRFAKWATGLSDIFIFIPLYLVTIDASVLYTICFLIGSCELYILMTYLPRLLQIATGRHDTFT
ncbi:MAG: CDP-alcohol phosphatidyltransferase family protein [Bdellovibrionales bacterium]